jgi:hypothetical protein
MLRALVAASADGRVYFLQQDFGGLGGGRPLPAGHGEAHRVAGAERAGAFQRYRAAGHEQMQERGVG